MPPSAELLTAVVFLPAIGGILLALFPAEDHRNLKATALGISLVTFVLSLGLWTGFRVQNPGFQFTADVSWIDELGISYRIGLDGVSLVLVVLTTFLTPLTILGAWNAIEHRVKEFTIAMLVLETGMLGAFAALDLFLFYVFWEAMLIPMYFLIGVWGGARRVYAAVKFFIFTMAGSLLMLIAILYVANQGAFGGGAFGGGAFGGGDFGAGGSPDGGIWSFALDDALRRTFTPDEEKWLFGAFALAFAIKVPMFPVHTWLPDAHVEAPTAGSVILAGVLLKLGVYGFIRFAFPMFPNAALAYLPVIGWLAVVGIVYGAVVAWVQPDMKKLVAYSSVSHLGFCMLGLAAMTIEGVAGAVFVMIAHGLSTGALFLLVGMLYERRHTRVLADYGGIARRTPIFAFFLVLTAMASAGLPALCGFPGEFLVLLGTFTAGGLRTMWAVIAASGVILAAVYLLWMVQKVLFGPLQNPANEQLEDLSAREIAVLAPIMAFALILGLRPGIVLERVEPAVQRFVVQVHNAANVPPYRADHGALRKAAMAPIRPQLMLRPADPRFRPAKILDSAGQPIEQVKDR
jgi:NADH-quinone oxidoreductase subunit M